MKPVLLLVVVLALALAGGTAQADDGWLGVQLQPLDAEMTKALQLKDDHGVLVNDVVDDSPAATAGLQHGDVIVAFGGDAVNEVKDLTKAVRKASPGWTEGTAEPRIDVSPAQIRENRQLLRTRSARLRTVSTQYGQ